MNEIGFLRSKERVQQSQGRGNQVKHFSGTFVNSTNTAKFLYSLDYSVTIKYSSKLNSVCY